MFFFHPEASELVSYFLSPFHMLKLAYENKYHLALVQKDQHQK